MPRNDPQENLGRDLLLTPFYEADEWQTLDLVTVPAGTPYRDEPVDLATARGVDNLRQALVLRLLTPLGSLRELGHAGYGSRLHELIGQENVEATRLRARAFILQALAQEPRVAEVLSLEMVEPSAGETDRLRFRIGVRPIAGDAPVTLGLEVGL